MVEILLKPFAASLDNVRDVYLENNLLFVPPLREVRHIYIGYSEQLNMVKIGMTKNLQTRERQINSAFKHLSFEGDFKILDAIPALEQHAAEIEAALHKKYEPARRRGEWFCADDMPDVVFSEEDCSLGYRPWYQEVMALTPESMALEAGRAPSAIFLSPADNDPRHAAHIRKYAADWDRVSRFEKQPITNFDSKYLPALV